MNFKKIIPVFMVSLCFSHALHGMEFVKDIVKNEVIPAAAIMATGAAIAGLSERIIWKIHGTSRLKNDAKANALSGALWSLPVVGAALLGSRSSRMEFSLKNCIVLGGLASLPYLAIGALTHCSRKKWKNVPSLKLDDVISYYPIDHTISAHDAKRFIAGLLLGLRDYVTYKKIAYAHATACFLVTTALIAKRSASR